MLCTESYTFNFFGMATRLDIEILDLRQIEEEGGVRVILSRLKLSSQAEL